MDEDEDEDKDMVMVVEGIPDWMMLMIVIPQMLRKRKPYYTTRSGVILR